MIEMRVLSIDNLEEIKELFKGVFTKEPWNDEWSDAKQLHEYMLDIMSARTPIILGLYENDILVGASIGNKKHWCGGTEYFIEELFIEASYQGKGLGTQFMKLIEDYILSIGIHQIYLQTEVDKPAYRFYKKLGFTELLDHRAFFKEF